MISLTEVTLRDGITLLAPGGAYVRDTRTLIVADTHAGTTLELRARGHAVPMGDDSLLASRIEQLTGACDPAEIVIAGDAIHGPGSLRTVGTQESPLLQIIASHPTRTFFVVLGNHDRSLANTLDRRGVLHGNSHLVGPHWVTHGDDVPETLALRAEALRAGGRVIVGHIHPALRLDDGEGASAICPAFVTARGLLCMPALSPWARGGDVRSKSVYAQLAALASGDPMGVAVIVGPRVMVVGDVFSPNSLKKRA
ncbi:MAG: metallophosphoesterase [Deltaproteobacteria bacterium]|nr:metallophosphoesterase [Deltaproteobacteria bacterium]